MPFSKNRNTVLRWSSHLLIVIGLLALAYVGAMRVDAELFQAYQNRRFQQELIDLKPSVSSDESLPSPSPLPSLAAVNRTNAESLHLSGREGSPLGRIEISAIDLDVMILEGIDDETLRLGVGHIPGTARPGQFGNVAIAGHRDTFFRPLRDITKDDEITLTTLNGSTRYRVDSTMVVDPEEIAVLNDSGDSVLTLVTCYPFNFVGSAPKRFIVRAHKL
jgi:sortase A